MDPAILSDHTAFHNILSHTHWRWHIHSGCPIYKYRDGYSAVVSSRGSLLLPGAQNSDSACLQGSVPGHGFPPRPGFPVHHTGPERSRHQDNEQRGWNLPRDVLSFPDCRARFTSTVSLNTSSKWHQLNTADISITTHIEQLRKNWQRLKKSQNQ